MTANDWRGIWTDRRQRKLDTINCLETEDARAGTAIFVERNSGQTEEAIRQEWIARLQSHVNELDTRLSALR
jgi:hypothetical protein